MAVSVREVAQRAGVSVGTVSNVLNRPAQVKDSTVQRVRDAIAELGYVPNAAARQLRAGQSTTLALVVLDVSNPFFTDVARGAESRAEEAGLTVTLANSDESASRERKHLEQFETQRVAGVLLVPTADAGDSVARLREHGIPVVLVDRSTADASVASVAVDDVTGGRMAASHLLESGRRRLAFVGGPHSIHQVADRYAGALAAVGDYADATLTRIDTEALTLDEGMRTGAQVRAHVSSGEVDAVFAANDLLAIGVQQALLSGDEPLSIPGDVALVGYDDISFAAAAVVPITSVRQPSRDIGSTAVELLLAERDADEATRRDHVLFQPELIIRASTRA